MDKTSLGDSVSGTLVQPLKLLLVTKRHFMTKDIIREAYGRQYELAVGLSEAGWNIKAYCLNYRSNWSRESVQSGGIEWYSYSPSLWFRWKGDIHRAVKHWKPHVVSGFSDALHISMASRVSSESPIRLLIDLHDNLDSQGMTRVPGFRHKVEKAIRSADLITCVSEPLRRKVEQQYSPVANLLVLENAISDIFREGVVADGMQARSRFTLHEDDTVIGVAGALYRKRGIETVLAGFERLRKENPKLVLALAGPTDEDRRGFDQEGVRYFGNLDWKSIPLFLKALDIGVVPNIRPVFADYCYPQKAVELCALSVPFVAANFGVMKTMAKKFDNILYEPDDPSDFARAVHYQLKNRVVLDTSVKTWSQQAEILSRSLTELLKD